MDDAPRAYVSASSPAQSSGAHGAPSVGTGSSQVQRGYDEGRQAHFVTGKFGLATGLNLIVSGAPKIATGTIAVTLSGYSRSDAVRRCERLEVLVNGEPFTTENNAATAHVTNVKIESRFDFSVFRPLAGRFPVFGVRACGTTWKFTPEQLEQLRALFVVYSDLAEELQSDPDAAPATAPGQTAL